MVGVKQGGSFKASVPSEVIIRGSDTSTLITRSAVASRRLEEMCGFAYLHRRTFESCKDRLGSSCCSRRANYTVSYGCCASHRLSSTPRSCIYGHDWRSLSRSLYQQAPCRNHKYKHQRYGSLHDFGILPISPVLIRPLSTLMATFPPAELQYQLDHKDDDVSRQLEAFFIVCMLLSACFVAARLASRRMMKLGVQVDDYTILASLVRMSYADQNRVRK